MYTTCTHVVQRSAVLADNDIRLIVKRQPASVRILGLTVTLQLNFELLGYYRSTVIYESSTR